MAKEEKILFTVVTVTYNSKDNLEPTIKSVAMQDFRNYEYLVIDGGSNDGTQDIIKKYENNITSWVSEADGGIYDAMNKAVKIAKGEWVVFLNSGDCFVSHNVLSTLAIHMQNCEYDVIYGDILIDSKGDRVIKEASEPCNKHRMYFCHQSAFVRTDILREMPFDLRFKMSADLHFFKRCYAVGKSFFHLHEPLVFFDRNGISNTNRIAGLRDNVQVVKDLDKGKERFEFLLRLYFVIYRIKLSSLFNKKKCRES